MTTMSTEFDKTFQNKAVSFRDVSWALLLEMGILYSKKKGWGPGQMSYHIQSYQAHFQILSRIQLLTGNAESDSELHK